MKSLTGLLVAFIAWGSVSQTSQAAQPQEGPSGFRDYKGQHYRVVNKTSYRVVDTAEFYLYSYNKLVQGEKIARPTTVYYFSAGANGPIQPLTIFNLEKTFSQNRAFCYRLHTDFSSDKDLMTYIPSLKTYKIKYAYGQSVK